MGRVLRGETPGGTCREWDVCVYHAGSEDNVNTIKQDVLTPDRKSMTVDVRSM